MKKLTIDSRPLLAHNIRQVQLKLGQYQVFCQTTAEQVVEILCTKAFPSKIDWKYPEQFLTLRQMAYIAKMLDKMDIEISILSANPIWAGMCKFDSKVEVIKGQEYGFVAYGHNFADLWDHAQ